MSSLCPSPFFCLFDNWHTSLYKSKAYSMTVDLCILWNDYPNGIGWHPSSHIGTIKRKERKGKQFFLSGKDFEVTVTSKKILGRINKQKCRGREFQEKEKNKLFHSSSSGWALCGHVVPGAPRVPSALLSYTRGMRAPLSILQVWKGSPEQPGPWRVEVFEARSGRRNPHP